MKKSDFLAKQFQLAFPNTKKNKEKSMFCRMKNDLISGIDEEEGEKESHLYIRANFLFGF